MALKIKATRGSKFLDMHAPVDKCNQISSTLHVCAYALRLGIQSGGIADDILSDIAETIHYALVANDEVTKFVTEVSDIQIAEFCAGQQQVAA